MAASLALTSSSYEAHFAIATGAVGASGAALAIRDKGSGAAPIRASNSRRVMFFSLLQTQSRAGFYQVDVDAGAFIHLVDFELFFKGIRRIQPGVLILTQGMDGYGIDRVAGIIHQMHQHLLAVARFEQVREHGRDVEQTRPEIAAADQGLDLVPDIVEALQLFFVERDLIFTGRNAFLPPGRTG